MEQLNWRPVGISGGKYWVSDCGKVKTVFRESKHTKVYRDSHLKPTKGGKKGVYLRIRMSWGSGSNRRHKSEFVHRLVAMAFVDKVEGKDHVNHKDGNKLNNHYLNLEWCTPQENNDHGVRLGLLKRGRKPSVYIKKGRYRGGTFKPILDLNTGIFWTSKELSNLFGINKRYITRLLNEERKPNTTQYRYV